MSLLALDNLLNGVADAEPLPRRSARPGRRAAAAGADPAAGAVQESADRDGRARAVRARRSTPAVRRYVTPHTLSPRAHLLSNGSYCRDGHQRRRRLQPAPAAGADALARGHHRATPGAASATSATSSHDDGLVDDVSADRPRAGRVRGDLRASIARCSAASTASIETRTEIVVSPEDDAELRRVSMTNHSQRVAQHRADQLRRGRAGAGRCRPGASGVQQPVRRDARPCPDRDALICARRPRSGDRASRTSFT